MDVSDENTGVQGSMCPYIPTKGMGVHIGTSMEKSKVKMFIRGIMEMYNKQGRYKPIQNIVKDAVGTVQKGISYAGALQQG